MLIRDEVVKGEAVMACYEINTLLGLAFFVAVNCRATEQKISKWPDRLLFPAKKTPNIVSKPPIPLLPTVADKAADLIKTSGVPSLGNQLGPRQLWIRFNVPQHRRIRHQLS